MFCTFSWVLWLHFVSFVSLGDEPFLVLCLHVCNESSLPNLPTEKIIASEEKLKNITFIDIAYTAEKQFYNCKKNEEAKQQIESYFKSFKSTCQEKQNKGQKETICEQEQVGSEVIRESFIP